MQGHVVVRRIEGRVVECLPRAPCGVGTEPPDHLVLAQAPYEADAEPFGPQLLLAEGRDERVRPLLGGDLLGGQLHRSRQLTHQRCERCGRQQPAG
ncbi:hypothetical protein SHIRM173S_09738 [Streptomyces hirsutus]